MRDLLPFVILGLTSGSAYGLAGVGLVLTYKTSGVFNFAFGALGTLAAYVFYSLNVSHGLPWPVAALLSTVVLGTVLGYVFELFARHLSRAALAVRIVAMLGIVLVIEGAFLLAHGTESQTFPTFLPDNRFKVFDAYVSASQLIIMGLALVLTLALYVFLHRTRLGMAMRAVVDDPALLDLAGTRPTTVRRIAWMIGTVCALMSGILLAQSTNLDPVTLTALVAQAFAAAALGAFASLPLAYAGGLAVGVLSAILTRYASSSEYLAGLPASLPFVVLFGVLVVLPRRRLATRLQSIPLPRAAWTAPLRTQIFFCLIALAALAFVPQFSGDHIGQWAGFLAIAIMFLSLGLLVRTSGQVSLCHAGFGAIGAVAFSKLATEAHLPWLLALLVAGLVVVPIGAVIAIPAIRLSGLYLALATFGFGLLLQNMFYNTSLMFGLNGYGVPMPRPHLSWLDLESDTGFYYVVLAVLAVATAVVIALTRTRLGRLLNALGDSPTALSMGGTSVPTTQVLVFCISAFLAGISGALLGVSLIQVDPTSFNPTLSLTYLALIVLAVGGAPWYALVQAAGLMLIPAYVTSGSVGYWLQIVFGLFAVLLAFAPQTRHVPGWVRFSAAGVARLLGERGTGPVPAAPDATPDPNETDLPSPPGAAGRPVGEGLRVDSLRVRFGGLVAVDHLALAAPAGQITGLIGPNGAGKTSTFDAICGLNPAAQGRVHLHGRDISGASPPARAAAGLGRTFQQMQLYDSLTVLENVRLGREAALAGRGPLNQIFAGRSRHLIDRAAREALHLCGIADLSDRVVGSLSTGQRRLTELARCLAGPFDLMLLDEPSSGLDAHETKAFGALLRRVVATRGVGILLVEHDMSLVMDLCDRIFVLDFGKPLFAGSPAEVTASDLVRSAYLGTGGPMDGTDRADASSGSDSHVKVEAR
ncbi:branched-chain amino acid ABC transporter permease/ATP-binding protein [Frankia sp. CcI49]|uniref:branched-chain amino acid ABC transporter permease/ATP-binding protein n=1 Tax=unclassified Frankia TaxID=2632575 RepID=UPI0006CA37AC|nr:MULTISPECIES: branched-chain amino acid ABC transporter permease/ATP-binding protein [unclassified Frankia]KPM51768.1 branched-chain amino acid ABC transporter ATPase [Frankia sp. R43]ONH59112.1 branched-chain amino acid ABC transporter permease/ATP-binding protein [Frankia sp. CcI49]